MVVTSMARSYRVALQLRRVSNQQQVHLCEVQFTPEATSFSTVESLRRELVLPGWTQSLNRFGISHGYAAAHVALERRVDCVNAGPPILSQRVAFRLFEHRAQVS